MLPSNVYEPLSADALRADLPAALQTLPITVFDVTDSTNIRLKAMALAGAPHGTMVLARSQTAGRGRQGRSFYSPDGTGLYASLLLRPALPVTAGQLYTVYAAVAACRAIERVCGVRPQIKWVNDLFYRERKICGILTESVIGIDSGRIEGVVIGVGINLTTSDFPQALHGIAGSLDTAVSPNRLAAALFEELLRHGDGRFPDDLLDAYRMRSLILGKAVAFVQNGVSYEGIAEWINEAGNLVVLLPDGTRMTLAAGEVSVRL